MKRNVFYKIFVSLFLFLPFVSAQTKRVISVEFFGQTIDEIHWDGVDYMCSQSPFVGIDGYRTVFGGLTDVKSDPTSPVDIDKNYRAMWMIRNDELYLYGIEMLDRKGNDIEKYSLIEKLTGRKFVKNADLSEKYPEGVLPATWFSGSIHMKRQPVSKENYCDCQYRCEPFMLVEFKDGKVISRKDDSKTMNIIVDSVDIVKHSDVYRDTGRRFVGRESRCELWLASQLSLTKNQYVEKYHWGTTMDELFMDDRRYICSGSPLTVLSHYENIYPDVPPCEITYEHPLINDKNYEVKWTIINDVLYLYDITIECLDKGNPVYKNRFKAMEDFLQKKFQPLPHPQSDKKGIAATWYNEILYTKRFPSENEGFMNCDYECEPINKIEFVNGKIKSIEKVSYIIVTKKKRD